MIAAGVDDLYKRRSKMMYDPNFSYSMRNEYVITTLLTWFKYFEKLIHTEKVSYDYSFDWYNSNGLNYDGPYFASGRLTWLDYLVFDMIESNCEFVEHTVNAIDEPVV